MKLFACQNCGQIVYFENTACTRCQALLGFAARDLEVKALAAGRDGLWRPLGDTGREPAYRACSNHWQSAACNWLVVADEGHAFCLACRLNRTIPDLASPQNLVLWQRLESEKRRLVYSLLRLGLPVVPKAEHPIGLAFDFLADTPASFAEPQRVLTGHAQGLITINIAEADPVTRERMRAQMAEPYRTILGHFRHESGHYYWDRLVRDTGWLDEVRALFGDDTADYAAALDHHYSGGPAANWDEQFVSAYASMHPWEDWAETWAHYLHIVDTLETAAAFGLSVRPRLAAAEALEVETALDPYRCPDFTAILAHWFPLTYALNSLNRSMGHEHVYPFVLPGPVLDKLGLVHRIVQASRS